MKETEIAVQSEQSKAVATPMPAVNMGGFDSSDFVIPRINLIQKMSKKNDGKQASYGELRDNLNNKFLGSIDHPMEFVPIHGEKKWLVYERDEKGRYQWKDTVAYDGEREFYSEDKSIKNMLSYEFYVLVPSEIENGEDMPYVISFQSTSSKAGKKLATQMFMKNLRMGKPVYAAAFNLNVHEETTDDNTYGVMDVSVSREVTEAESKACALWQETIMNGKTKVSEED